MPSTKSRDSKTNRLCSVALVCLVISLLLVFISAPELTQVAGDSGATTEGLIRISPGSSTRREVAGGVKESFEIAVGQEQLLRFSIDKGDLVLSTVLYGPTGIKLLEQVSQEFEVVELSFPADVAGMYRIEIRSQENAQTPRQYELKVYPLTEAKRRSKNDSEARQAMARAEVLRANWTEVGLREAIEKYDQAALSWTTDGNFSSASLATMRSGDVHFLLSQYRDALKRYQTAATLSVQANDRLGEARALSQMGRLYSYIGRNDLAQKYLTKALDFFERGEANQTPMARNAYSEALSNLAEVNYAKGNLVKASTQLEGARKVLHNDRKGEAKIHLFAGYIAGSIGEPQKAFREISQALDLYRAINNKAGEGLALTALGLYHSLKREDLPAIKLHRSALEIFRAIGDRHSEGIALNAFGQAYENMGDYQIAMDSYEKALRLFQNNGALDLASAATFKVARIHRLTGNFEEALSYYKSCLRLSRAARKVRTEANALNEIAAVYESQGRPRQTLAQYQRIQKFYQTIRDRRGQAVTLNTYGDFLRRINQKQRAVEAYRQALNLSEEVGDKGILISTFYNLAGAHQDLGRLDAALDFINKSLKVIEELRKNVGSPDLRASYFSGVRKHYDLCIEILMQLDKVRSGEGFAGAALLMSEKSRARSLVDLIAESPGELRQGAAANLVDHERELKGLLRSLGQYVMNLSQSKKDATEVAEVNQQMVRLRSEYEEIQAQLREHQRPLLALETSGPLSLEKIQKELRDSDTMLLEYSLGEESSYLWAVTYNSLHSYALPPRKVLEDAADEFYQLVTARQVFDAEIKDDYQAKIEKSDRLYLEKANSLSQMLLGPVAEQLGNRRLLLVTEGALQYVPFEALPVPVTHTATQTELENIARPPLIVRHEVVGMPSISTLLAIRARKNPPSSPSKIVAVIADPVFSRNDDRVEGAALSAVLAGAPEHSSPESTQGTFELRTRNAAPARLTHASEEADAISAAAPHGASFVAKGFDASRETATSSRVRQYQIIHFATHGFLHSEHPELSGIVLSMVDPNGVEQNGLMSLHDISSLDLPAELTVLSACQTGLGKDVKGEGFVGLTHSFMSAGSKSVLASLWKVDDRATSVLMADLYQSMLHQGMPPATALRSAKLKIMQEKQWVAPYYWAGFVLQGEYTNRIAVDGRSWLRLDLVLFSCLIVVSSGLILFQRRKRRSVSA